MNKTLAGHDSWVFVVPIANLHLTRAVKGEFRICRATFVSAERLARRRRQYGLPARISELKNERSGSLSRILTSDGVFAVVRHAGVLSEVEDLVLNLIREELALLTLSQLGYAKRRDISTPAVSEERPQASRSYVVLSSKETTWIQPNKRVGKLFPLYLNEDWVRFQKEGFFFDLLKLLRGDIHVDKGWRDDVRNAAVLLGQSQASIDVPQAFLWNMIALECLLTRQGDTYRDALPARAEAFLGWTGYWASEDFETRIIEVYRKRSAFVHSGRRELISLQDLFFTDDLLLNLLVNIIGHHKLFTSKDAVIEFSKRVAAEHVLGIDAKVRPKTFRFWKRNYSDRDFSL